jgi:ribosome modulation factor
VKNLEFRPQRITREYRQTINAKSDKVFPLLCPVREADWLDGWRYNMIYSESGLVEEGAVFSTPYQGEVDTVWIVTNHDSKTYKVEFVRFTHKSRTCILKISVKSKDDISSYVDVSYTYTGITPSGNDFINNFTKDAFLEAVTFWEKSMNYFLETGERLNKA